MLSQGTAVAAGSPGVWKVGWVVPRNAELTNVNKRYRLQTVMVDAELRQYEVSFEFDIVEHEVPAQKPELQQLITFSGEPIRITFTNTLRPDYLKVKVVPRHQDTAIIHFAQWVYPVPAPLPPNTLQEVERDNFFVYFTDTPALPRGEYAAIWTIRDYPTSENAQEHQIIEVVSNSMMFLAKSVRMAIDKLQKRLGIVSAYTNADIIEYLHQGLNYVNGFFPPTSYSEDTLPGPAAMYVVMAAIWWGLTAQRTLYAELNFDFSGQTVTLGYNPGADLDSIISNYKETLDTQLTRTKKTLVRSSSAVGSVAARPYRFRSSLIYKVGSGQGQDVMRRLIEFGLLD